MVELCPYALGKEETILELHADIDVWEMGCSIFQKNDTSATNLQKIPLKKMDNCIPKDAIVGFVKADVEGALLDVLEGGRNTISKNRPVLSLAVYHSPKELFEGKPFLESFLDDYVYEFHHFNFEPKLFSELTLFAYPREVLNSR